MSRTIAAADAFGMLSYLAPATEQLQRLDLSNNHHLCLSPTSESDLCVSDLHARMQWATMSDLQSTNMQ